VTPVMVEILLTRASIVLVLLTVVGIFARGRERMCWSFISFLLFSVTTNVLISSWPERFYTYSFYVVMMAVYGLARMCVATELAYWAFRAFPGARATARTLLLLILGTTTLAIVLFTAPPGSPGVKSAALQWMVQVHSRMITGAIWMLTATSLLVVWYHLPVHALHRAILLSYTSYLLVTVTGLNVLGRYGWQITHQVGVVDQLAWLVAATWFTRAAWRLEPHAETAPETASLLNAEGT